MLVTYSHPPQVQPGSLDGRPLLSLPEGGRVALDRTLLRLWQAAEGRTLDELLQGHRPPGTTQMQLRAALACLAEAGLLQRSGEIPPATPPAVAVRLAAQPAPAVSAILVTYNSQDWLDECLTSLLRQTIPPAEIILVDNGSSQDPTDWLNTHYPAVRVLRLSPALGLAQALNRGVALACGEYLLLLNPDLTLQPDALEQMLQVAASHPQCAAVAPELRFWWAPAFLNGLGNQAGALGWGSDNGLGHLDLGQFDGWREVPSACFAAALLTRQGWQRAGPLDAGFPMYYEDIEWCYRARLLGMKIFAAPQAIAFHALGQRLHTGEVEQPGGHAALSPAKLRHVTYGRLRFAFRLLQARHLRRALAGYALADLALVLSGLIHLNLAKVKAVLSGWGMFFRRLAELRPQRRDLQSRRVTPDEAAFAMQRSIPPPLIWQGVPELTWDIVTQVYLPLLQAQRSKPVPEFTSPAPRLLIISHDIVDEKMAGPGMRYLEMARALGTDLPVTLAIPNQTRLEIPGVSLVSYQLEQPASLWRLAQDSDVLLLSSFILEKFPFIKDLPARRVIDLYDPLVLENLHLYQTEPMEVQTSLNTQAVQMMNRLVAQGDFFLCGNERQRDFWMGVLAANGRINPHTFAQDSSLRRLIDVVGVGFPARPPQGQPLLRGVHPAFPPEAQIVLWGGGIWDWLDPLTLVKAWPEVLRRHPEARLVFLGTRHPNPLVPRHAMADAVETLAKDTGEKDKTIFLFEWLSYADREALLCESAVGVVLHPLHLETRYSIRTRVLDYLWAGLPVLVTQGDVTSQWVLDGRLGRVIPPLDATAAAQALDELLSQPKSAWAEAFAPLKQTFAWTQVVAPLRAYCLSGNSAPDRGASLASPDANNAQPVWKSNLARARSIWRREGLGALLRRLRRHIQWRLSRF